MPQLSVVIVTYNSERDIYPCLDSVFRHNDLGEGLEVIVVDNCSAEGEKMFANIRDRYTDEIRLISNTRNGGYGQGNNVGIRAAQAPVVLIMNPDVRLIAPVFRKAVEAFRRHPRLSLYGMKQMLSLSTPSTNSFACTYRMNGYLRVLLSALTTRLDLYLPRWQYFSGACFFVRREMFEAVGLFDETNFMYGEEEDIHYRLARRFGYGMRYNPALRFVHLIGDRPMTAAYKLRQLEALLALNAKKGYSPRRLLQDVCRANRLHLLCGRLKASLGRTTGADGWLREFHQACLQRLAQIS